MSIPTPVLVGEDYERDIFVWRVVDDDVPLARPLNRDRWYIAGYCDIDRRIHEYFPGLLFYGRSRLPGDYGHLGEDYGGTHVDVTFVGDMCFLTPANYPDVREQVAARN